MMIYLLKKIFPIFILTYQFKIILFSEDLIDKIDIGIKILNHCYAYDIHKFINKVVVNNNSYQRRIKQTKFPGNFPKNQVFSQKRSALVCTIKRTNKTFFILNKSES